MIYTIDDMDPLDLASLLHEVGEPPRARFQEKRHIAQRWLLLREEYDHLGREWIARNYEDPELVEQICAHALPVYNALKRAADRLAVAYRKKPRREIYRSKGNSAKWIETLKSIHFNMWMAQANKLSIGVNTIVMLPRAARRSDGSPTIDFHIVTGAIADVYRRDELATLEGPDVLAYRVCDDHRRNRMGYEYVSAFGLPNDFPPEDAPYIVTVDARYYTTWNSVYKEIDRKEHGMGVFPGVPIRNTLPPEDRWWDPYVNKGVVRTVEIVHRIIAEMNLTRRSHRSKQLVATAQNEEETDLSLEGESLGDPDRLWKMRGGRVEALDLVAKVQDFKDHVTMLQDEAFEQMTGAVARLADPDPSNPLIGDAALMQQNAVNLHREWQVTFVEPADIALQYRVALLASRIGMDSVSPELVRERARVHFSDIPLVQDPAARLDYHIKATKFGISDQIEARREQTGETREEAKAALIEMANDRAELYDVLSRRNLPSDPTADPREGDDATEEADSGAPGERLEARQGRRGGRATPPAENEREM